ncbi:MAG: hypothetical protein L3K06_00650 [Thermoplasmata archaeon]|nr:hypothetical protein [Thermoplasmata archaeon]
MAWTLYRIASQRKTELDQALSDDQVSRQSHKIRDAATAGGPSGELYVLIEGGADGVRRADELLAPLGTKLPPAEAEALHTRFKDEDEAAAAGMGLFFTEE